MRTPIEPSRQAHAVRSLWLGAMLLAGGLSGGCASFANPTTPEAIPVHRLPPEVFGRPREEERTIPLTLLRQKPPDVYLIDAGDVLGVYVEGVLGSRDQPPPVYIDRSNVPGQPTQPPAIGYPILVQENGVVSLPLIEPLNVKNKTRAEVEDMIKKAYISTGILVAGKERILVSLLKQRTYHVTVIRQDSGGVILSAGQFVNSKRGTGIALDLNAYENDVLNALAKSGGLPGLDASNTVVIQRGGTEAIAEGATVASAMQRAEQIRVPLRMRPNETLPFRPDDVVLRNGDIIFIESRDTELYYTGGLMPVGEFVLPRDYDLDVMEAVTQARGPLFNGGINFNNFVGNITVQGLGSPSPSLVTVIRKTPNCGQVTIRVDLNRAAQDPRERILVQPGDFLILQETIGESFTRYVTQTLRFNFLGTLLQRQDLTITGTYTGP